MAITDAEAARQMAELHPDLHQSRQIAFGQNYLEDLEKGTGTSQYYTGFGLAPDWVTGAIGAPATTPVVQEPTAGDAQVASQIAAQDRDAGITGASAIQPTISDPFLASGAAGGERLPTMDQAGAIAAVTQPEAYNIPGTMPQTPVSGVWGPQDYLQPEPFVQDPTGMIPQLGSQEDPAWWESARDKFVTTGQDVGNIFTDLAGQGIDVAKMAGSAILNFIQPGLGLMTQMLPQDTPIDKFNREYALGGDLYQNVVSQVDDPKFEGRLEGYADDLIAGTGEGKDPFGKNTVSLAGDYPAYATKTYNELIEKQKQRATEDKELTQFDKDRLDYYGHVSGLTGKTNIPGTPLMVDDSPLKTFPGGDIIPLEKPDIDEGFQTRFTAKDEEAWKGPGEISGVAGTTIVDPNRIDSTVKVGRGALGTMDRTKAYPDYSEVTGIEGPPSEIYRDPIMDIAAEQAARENALQEELEAYRDPIRDMVPVDDRMPENLGLQPYESWMDYEDPIMGMVDEDLIDLGDPLGDERIVPEREGLIADKQMAMEFERQQVAEREEMERAAIAREEAAVRASLEAAQRAEDEQRARNREEAAQRDREAAAQQAAAERAAAASRAAAAAAAQARDRHRGDGGGGSGAVSTGAGRNPWGRARGGLIRKSYGKGGIVDLL